MIKNGQILLKCSLTKLASVVQNGKKDFEVNFNIKTIYFLS